MDSQTNRPPQGRPTEETKKRRAAYILSAANMLAVGYHRWEVKQWLKGFGYKSMGCTRIVRAAQALLVERQRVTREDARGASLEVYQGLVRDKTLPPQVRLQAQQRIDKLLGLEEPTVIHQKVDAKQDNTLHVTYEGDDWRKVPRFSVDAESEN